MWHRMNAREGDIIRIRSNTEYKAYIVGDVGVVTAALKPEFSDPIRGIIAQFFRPFEDNKCFVNADDYEVKERNLNEG